MKIIISIFVGLLFFSSVLHSEDKKDLVVYTYDSFNSDWGPGPKIEKAFENICDCDLKFVTTGDGAEFKDGLLSIHLHRDEPRKEIPRKIFIKS